MAPEGLEGVAVRCGVCRTPFKIPAPKIVADDTIAGWLDDDPDVDLSAQTAAPFGEMAEGISKDPPTPKAEDKPKGMSGKRLRVVSLERRGVLFEFPAELLRRDAFRCAIPRRCTHCQAKGNLSAHIVIFTSELRDSISLEAEHKAGHLTIPQGDLGDGQGSIRLLTGAGAISITGS